MITVSNQQTAISYAYSGLNDRLQETVNGSTTTFTMDLNAGLTQALSDGTYNYLYGLARIAQLDAGTQAAEYFLGDALDSVRQLTNAAGAITYARNYDPYGVVAQTSGASQSAYGYTNQYTSQGLVYLRARHYDPDMGRFFAKDPSGLETNPYWYASANPIYRSDPTGLVSISDLTGPAAFIKCFDLHSLSKGQLTGEVSAQDAVNICKIAYSTYAWNRDWFNLSGQYPTSGHDLFGWFLFEQGENTHLTFDANQPLTQELAKSKLVFNLRFRYYMLGETPANSYLEYRFNYLEQAQCLMDFYHINSISMPVSCVLGSFYYQIKTLDNGQSIGFRIDNRTDLESGTHIATRFPGGNYGGSVEELIEDNPNIGKMSLTNVINTPFNGRRVVSILKYRTRDETGFNYGARNETILVGGGALTQTYVWKEKFDRCGFFPYLPLDSLNYGRHLNIQLWSNYKDTTTPIQW